jgi:RsiW-degrading membrane proteinase PrsW (M82 family)
MMFGLAVWLLSFGFGGLWLRGVMRIDTAIRYKDDYRHFKWIFALGVGSAFVSLVLYSVGDVVAWSVGAMELEEFRTYYDVLIVGPAEEGAKLLVTLFVLRAFGKVREPLDVMIKAMVVALGFATIENVTYGFRYGSLWLVVFRSAFTSSGHMAYAALWGFALGDYLAGRRYGLDRPVLPIPFFLLLAAFVHGVYNLIPGVPESLAFEFIVLSVAALMLRRLIHGSPFRDFTAQESGAMLPVIELALRANEDNPLLHFRHGRALLWERRYSNALEAFERMQALRPKSRVAALYIGICEVLLGQDEHGARRVHRALAHRGREADRVIRRILQRRIRHREDRAYLTQVLIRPRPEEAHSIRLSKQAAGPRAVITTAKRKSRYRPPGYVPQPAVSAGAAPSEEKVRAAVRVVDRAVARSAEG